MSVRPIYKICFGRFVKNSSQHMYIYVCMYGRMAEWLERQSSDHATQGLI